MFSSSRFGFNKPVHIKPGRNRHGQRITPFKFISAKFAQIKFSALLAICVVLVFSWQFIKPGLNNFTPVENVKIVSAFKHIPLSELRQQVINVLSGGYFSVDIDAIRNGLLDLPWVEDVSVRRQWPSGLHIRVIEKQAVAYWGDASLLSNRGELFTPVSVDRDQSLPQLDGPEGFHQKVWVFLQEINRDIKPMGIEVKKLALDERRAWMLGISNNSSHKDIEIRLGRANIDHRLARFMSIFSNRGKEFDDIRFIDLRYPNGFAMGKAMSQRIDQKLSKENVMRNTGIVSRRTEASQALKRGAAT
jgi:cell division protein FtsQ